MTQPLRHPVTQPLRQAATGESYDVVVVGGGPAGASAARAAARGGARTVLLERAVPPRYKTCGGGLVRLSADLAEVDLAPLVHDTVDRLTLTLDGCLAVTRRMHRGLGMTLRDGFDAALLDAAAGAGAEVRTGAAVSSVTSGGHVRLRSGEQLTAGVVVGADGSAGRCAAVVGVSCGQVDLGLEGEFTAPDRSWNGRGLLDWGPVPGSYGWLFPKGDRWTVGVIGGRAHAPQLRRYYRSLVERLGLGGAAPLVESGHLTRVRDPGSPLANGRVLVAGDAGGLLEPWTREGISYALRSGRLAGECSAAGDVAGYAPKVAAALGAEVEAGRLLLAAFTRRPALFHAVLAGPAFGLFERLVDARTSFARQFRRPGAARLVRALA